MKHGAANTLQVVLPMLVFGCLRPRRARYSGLHQSNHTAGGHQRAGGPAL